MKYLNKRQKTIIICIVLISVIALYYYKNVINQNEFNEIEENIEMTTKEDNDTEDERTMIKVHVCGEVNVEGVIELEENSRVSDAIEKAGGLKENANMEDINLASVLEDGMKVYIPSIDDKNNIKESIGNNVENSLIKSENNVKNKNNISNSSKSKKININTATQSELETLPGIGGVTAQKIINYRKENGKFKTIEDIKKVSGIGETKFNKLKDLIDVK